MKGKINKFMDRYLKRVLLIYWFYWIIAILFFTSYRKNNSVDSNNMPLLVFAILSISLMLINGILSSLESYRFKKYLNLNYKEFAKNIKPIDLTYQWSPIWRTVKWQINHEIKNDLIIKKYIRNATMIYISTIINFIFSAFYIFYFTFFK